MNVLLWKCIGYLLTWYLSDICEPELIIFGEVEFPIVSENIQHPNTHGCWWWCVPMPNRCSNNIQVSTTCWYVLELPDFSSSLLCAKMDWERTIRIRWKSVPMYILYIHSVVKSIVRIGKTCKYECSSSKRFLHFKFKCMLISKFVWNWHNSEVWKKKFLSFSFSFFSRFHACFAFVIIFMGFRFVG